MAAISIVQKTVARTRLKKRFSGPCFEMLICDLSLVDHALEPGTGRHSIMATELPPELQPKAKFTLEINAVTIGIFVVFGIIMIFSLLGAYHSAQRKVRDERRLADLGAVVQALDLYHADYSSYPPADNWKDLGQYLRGGNLYGNSYLNSFPLDPTNKSTYQYQYTVHDNGNSYQIQWDLEGDNKKLLSHQPS